MFSPTEHTENTENGIPYAQMTDEIQEIENLSAFTQNQIQGLDKKGLRSLRHFLSFLHYKLKVPAEAINWVLRTTFKAVNASLETAGYYAPLIELQEFLKLWPEVQPRAVPYIMYLGLPFMFVGLLSGLANMFKSKRMQNTRDAWEGLNKSFNLAYFVLFAVVSLVVASLREANVPDEEIDKNSNAYPIFAASLVLGLLLGGQYGGLWLRKKILDRKYAQEIEQNNLSASPAPMLADLQGEPSWLKKQFLYWTETEHGHEHKVLRKENRVIRGYEHGNGFIGTLIELYIFIILIEMVANGSPNTAPEYQFARFGGVSVAAGLLTLLNVLFYERLHGVTHSCLSALFGANMAGLLYSNVSGDTQSTALSENDKTILTSAWTTMMSIPIILLALQFFIQLLRYCLQKSDHAPTTRVRNEELSQPFARGDMEMTLVSSRARFQYASEGNRSLELMRREPSVEHATTVSRLN